MIFLILKFWIFLKNSVYILRVRFVNRILEEKVFPHDLFFLLVKFLRVYYTTNRWICPHPFFLFWVGSRYFSDFHLEELYLYPCAAANDLPRENF